MDKDYWGFHAEHWLNNETDEITHDTVIDDMQSAMENVTLLQKAIDKIKNTLRPNAYPVLFNEYKCYTCDLKKTSDVCNACVEQYKDEMRRKVGWL